MMNGGMPGMNGGMMANVSGVPGGGAGGASAEDMVKKLMAEQNSQNETS